LLSHTAEAALGHIPRRIVLLFAEGTALPYVEIPLPASQTRPVRARHSGPGHCRSGDCRTATPLHILSPRWGPWSARESRLNRASEAGSHSMFWLGSSERAYTNLLQNRFREDSSLATATMPGPTPSIAEPYHPDNRHTRGAGHARASRADARGRERGGAMGVSTGSFREQYASGESQREQGRSRETCPEESRMPGDFESCRGCENADRQVARPRSHQPHTRRRSGLGARARPAMASTLWRQGPNGWRWGDHWPRSTIAFVA
jgi:hypothetical protein